ncbi:MAG: hypothetical protein F4X04_13095 [Holophagales bacterium]|nr:hypothetical protein [Holophagales bacterium]MYD23160.1 hypothetical protein [Holophagales bacterium]
MGPGEPVEVNGTDIARFGHLPFEQAPRVDLHLADDQDRLAVLGGGLHMKALRLEFTPEEISQALENVTGHGYTRSGT